MQKVSKRTFFYDTEFMEKAGSIELISIGIVSADGARSFHAVNKDADHSNANPWVVENVLKKLPPSTSPVWMSHEEIAKGVLEFLKPTPEDPIELWGYLPGYDHVVLCWLFGATIDLPHGMPMVTFCVHQLATHLGLSVPEGDPSTHHDALADAEWARAAHLALLERNKSDVKIAFFAGARTYFSEVSWVRKWQRESLESTFAKWLARQ